MREPVGGADDKSVERVAPVEAGSAGCSGIGGVWPFGEVGRPALLGITDDFAVFVTLVGVAGDFDVGVLGLGEGFRVGDGFRSPASSERGAMRTPSWICCPSRRLSASVIGSRKCRSISFCTKLLGTDSRANPSTMVSGWTRLSQALCWGVRGVTRVVRLAARPSAVDSPLSSETTAFHTVVKLEPGSSVNDASPWSLRYPGFKHKTVQNHVWRQSNCPHSYAQVWTGG